MSADKKFTIPSAQPLTPPILPAYQMYPVYGISGVWRKMEEAEEGAADISDGKNTIPSAQPLTPPILPAYQMYVLQENL